MLTAKQNFLETIKGGKPDRFVKGYEYMTMVPGDPVNFYVRGARFPGMEPKKDKWGTTIVWPEGEMGATPAPGLQVLEDIEEWEDVIKVPDLIANCDAAELWEPYLERFNAVDRENTLATVFAPTGIFERLHFLMGFEDTLCNVMMEPELMADLAMAIGEYRAKGFKLMVEHAHPDCILSHDDWGSKQNLFMQPELWREIIKPAYEPGYNYLHEQGVIIVHHSDSFCQPIIKDMIDLHIDVWQGTLPSNDILKCLEDGEGKIAFQGGLDSGIFDGENSTEEEIRADVRRVCKEYATKGFFIPSITYGGPGAWHKGVDEIIDDEIDKCSAEFFGK